METGDCPGCGRTYQFKPSDRGKRCGCDTCGHRFLVGDVRYVASSKAAGVQSLPWQVGARIRPLFQSKLRYFVFACVAVVGVLAAVRVHDAYTTWKLEQKCSAIDGVRPAIGTARKQYEDKHSTYRADQFAKTSNERQRVLDNHTRAVNDELSKRRMEIEPLQTRLGSLEDKLFDAKLENRVLGENRDAIILSLTMRVEEARKELATKEAEWQSRLSQPLSLPEYADELSPGFFTVRRVVDGDTLDVSKDAGDIFRVRLLEVDTPERGQPDFKEASDFLDSLVRTEGGKVYLEFEFEDRPPTKDRFDRILAYAFSNMADSPFTKFVNAEIILQGFSKHYTEFGKGRYGSTLDWAEQAAAARQELQKSRSR